MHPIATPDNAHAAFSGRNLKDYLNRKSFTWKLDSTNNFRFYFESGTLAENRIEELKQHVEQSRVKVLQLLGVQDYPHQIHVFLVDSRSRMKSLVGRETNGMASPKIDAVFYVFNNRLENVGSHEFCHVIADNLWGKRQHWVSEGLAVYSDDKWHGNDLHDLSKHLLLKGKLIPLENLIKNFRQHTDLITYPEAGSFVKFLYEKYGVSKLKKIWKRGAAGIPQTFGKSLTNLEKKWHKVLEQADTSKVQST